MGKWLIGICGTDIAMREKIKNICSDVLKLSSVFFEIIQFEDGEQFLSCGRDVDVLIIDIEMTGKSRQDVKQYIRKISGITKIIFVASDSSQMFSGVGVRMYGLVLKSQLEERLGEMISSVLQEVSPYMLLDKGIDSREILYICSEHIYSRFVMSEGREPLIRISLNELERMLSKQGFIRVHRGYLVNARQIEHFSDREIMICGIRIPVSSRRKSQVKEKYRQYCGESMGHS